jgi:hypothetical protein
MKKLSLSNAEVQHLRDIYQEELEKSIKRIEHLSAILKKIDADFVAPEVPVVEEIERAKKMATAPKTKPAVKAKAKSTPTLKSPKAPAVKPKVTKAKTKTTRKPRKPIKRGSGKSKVKWNDFVLNTLSKAKKPIKSAEFANEALAAFKPKEADVPRLKQAISATLSKLVTTDKKLLANKLEGTREKTYGLKEWYDDKGNLLPDFK